MRDVIRFEQSVPGLKQSVHEQGEIFAFGLDEKSLVVNVRFRQPAGDARSGLEAASDLGQLREFADGLGLRLLLLLNLIEPLLELLGMPTLVLDLLAELRDGVSRRRRLRELHR